MTRKVEVFRLESDGIPKKLVQRLTLPSHIPSQGHILTPYVADFLLPVGLDVLLLEDLDQFYQKLMNSLLPLSQCCGLYVAEHHVWASQESYEKINDELQKVYGIQTKRAVLMPQERVDYWSMIHESLHDVFNHLLLDKRAALLQSAIASYDSSEKFFDMLSLTHLGISHFAWDLQEIGRRMQVNQKQGRSPIDGFDDFYVFGKLRLQDQLQVMDEFISNFFANDRGKDRWDKRYLLGAVQATLQDVGYNMKSPPEVKY